MSVDVTIDDRLRALAADAARQTNADGGTTRSSRGPSRASLRRLPPSSGYLSLVTFQRKLLFGFSLMVLPALLVGAEAIRSNVLERRALTGAGREHGAHAHLRRARDRHVRPDRAHLARPERPRSHRPEGVPAHRGGRRLLAGPLARRAQARGDGARRRGARASSARSSPCPTASSGWRTPAGARRPTGSPSASSRAGCSPRSPR